MQTPIVRIGTEFPAGTVTAVKSDHILLATAQGEKQFTFPQIESFINALRMLLGLYHKRDGSEVDFLYPLHGKRHILRRVKGVKVNSYTDPNGRGIIVKEDDGSYTSCSESKCVDSL